MTIAFILPCAINDHASPRTALDNVLKTLSSMRQVSPPANIALIEYSKTALNEEQRKVLMEHVSLLAQYDRNERIDELSHLRGEKQAHTASHVAALTWFLATARDEQLFKTTTRLIVMEPGATITEDIFEALDSNHSDKYIFGTPETSDLSPRQTGGIGMKFNIALWSFAVAELENLVQIMWQTLDYVINRIRHNGYSNLAHAFYKFTDSSKIFYYRRLNSDQCAGTKPISARNQRKLNA